MDPVKILGGLLGQRATRPGSGGGAILGQVLNGVAQAVQAQSQTQTADPRFAPQQHGALESLVRDAIVRQHQAGGQLPNRASGWVQRQAAPPTVQRAPSPQHNDQDRHQQQQHGGLQQGTHQHGAHPFGQQLQAHCSGLNQNQRAELLIQAMIMASQADGQIDTAEQDNIVQQLQPLDQNEVTWLRREFNTRHDVHSFVHAIPQGMEYEVYQVSLMAMNLDTQNEAAYLRDLAQCLRIDPQVCNQIHARVGAPVLY